MTECMIDEFDCSYRDCDDNCTRAFCPFLFLDEDMTFAAKHEELDQEVWVET